VPIRTLNAIHGPKNCGETIEFLTVIERRYSHTDREALTLCAKTMRDSATTA
jgi:hypothetical protein